MGFLFREFAFDFDSKVGFGFAAGEHGDSTFGANLDFKFEVEFVEPWDFPVGEGSMEYFNIER